MMLEKIYDKYDFDQDYEVYKYGQQVLIFNSIEPNLVENLLD